MYGEIGKSAGQLWGKLADNGPLTIKQLKTKTGMDTELLIMGLGWLAREDKIALEKTGKKTIEVALK